MDKKSWVKERGLPRRGSSPQPPPAAPGLCPALCPLRGAASPGLCAAMRGDAARPGTRARPAWAQRRLPAPGGASSGPGAPPGSRVPPFRSVPFRPVPFRSVPPPPAAMRRRPPARPLPPGACLKAAQGALRGEARPPAAHLAGPRSPLRV